MASDIKVVVEEKIKQLNGMIVSSSDEADFILFVSANDDDIISKARRIENANYISDLIKSHKKVALVDLSTHFDKNETLLPVMIAQNVNINALIAYSGWNTVSNALAQAIIFCSSLNKSESVLQVYADNLTFLNQRIIEDYFYLKDSIDAVNHALKKNGSYDTSYLNLGTEYEFATFVLRAVMHKKISDYKQTISFNEPIEIRTNNGTQKIKLKDLSVETLRFPWIRTFEIELKIKPKLIIYE